MDKLKKFQSFVTRWKIDKIELKFQQWMHLTPLLTTCEDFESFRAFSKILILNHMYDSNTIEISKKLRVTRTVWGRLPIFWVTYRTLRALRLPEKSDRRKKKQKNIFRNRFKTRDFNNRASERCVVIFSILDAPYRIVHGKRYRGTWKTNEFII